MGGCACYGLTDCVSAPWGSRQALYCLYLIHLALHYVLCCAVLCCGLQGDVCAEPHQGLPASPEAVPGWGAPHEARL